MKSAHFVLAFAIVSVVAGLAVAQTEWVLDPGEPVLEATPEGSWDHGLRFIEEVIEVDGFFHMFYRGQSESTISVGPFAIGHATSTDGVEWQLDPANPVLTPGAEGEWDGDSIRGATVIHDGAQFRMWYAATTPSEYGLDDVWHGIGYATSIDGSTWEKHTENPIIRPGANGTFAVPQTVIFDGERYTMWYVSAEFWTDGGYPASSDDGLTWEFFNFTEPARWPSYGLSVVFDGTRYVMMRYSWGYDPFLLGAASETGSSWTDFARNPLENVTEPPYIYGASPALLSEDGAYVMWFSSYWGIHRATSTCCATTATWFIAAAAYGSGASGSSFRTEVEVNNAGEQPAEYRFVWFPRGRDNSEWERSQLFVVQPRESTRHSNVLADVFGLAPGSFGALGVEATSQDVLAAGRIVSSAEPGAGSVGQNIPTLRPGDFNQAWRYRILFGSEGADARFNVACFRGWSVNPAWRDVELSLFDSDGTFLDTHLMRLAPWGTDQINRVFGDHRPVDGYVEVTRSTDIYCFGSVLDNTTNDPTTILPR